MVTKIKYAGLYSSIVGGSNNTASRYYSVIGGSGNNDAGFTATIFGQGITAVANNTLHVNCLNAAATPISTLAPFPVGTIFHLENGSPVPANSCPLYIQLP